MRDTGAPYSACALFAFVKTRPDLEVPDIEFMFRCAPLAPHRWFPMLRPAYQDGYGIRPTLLHPRSRGEVLLRSANARDPARIFPKVFSDPSDLASLYQGFERARDLAYSEPMDPYRGERIAPTPAAKSRTEIEEWLRKTANTAHHPSGTCAMGTGPDPVLDPALRVLGVERLRVVDASAMPDPRDGAHQCLCSNDRGKGRGFDPGDRDGRESRDKPMTDMKDLKTESPAIGRPVERVEDARLLQGQGSYVNDLGRAGMLAAAILRSQVAHGRIRGIDVSACLALPGVVAVFTAADVAAPVPRIPLRQEAHESLLPFEQPVIAHDKVRYVGEPLAVVVADSRERAEDALDAIRLDIEQLPAVSSRDGAATNDPVLHEATGTNCAITLRALKGDADVAFRDAPYTRRERLSVHRHTAIPIETRGLLAHWDSERRTLVVQGAAKVPFANRRILAKMLGLEEGAIEMIECDVGGAFGVRGEFYPEDFLIPFAAKRLGRPVKWVESRSEHFLATNHARDADCELEIACSRDGIILALRGSARTDVGAYVRTVGVTPSRNIAQICSGPYRIPHIAVDVSLYLTNKTPVATYRAPGRFEADFFRERLLDLAAADLGIDRVEFRRRNLVSESEMPYALATVQPFGDATEFDSGNYALTLERCLDEFDWTAKARSSGALIDGRRHGIAIGCYIEGGASGPCEGARLVLESDGRIAVYTGSSAVGQGLETVFTQITADALGVPMSRIRGVFHGSTNLVTEGFGSYSSRSVVMGGSAIVVTAAKLQQAMREAAAAKLGCGAEQVVLAGGRAAGPGDRSLDWSELAGESGLAAEGSFASRKRTYSYGAHAAHVAVDPETGVVAVLDYVAVEDVGRIINPRTLHGQTLGAVVQGLGGVLLEELVYDEEGQLLSGSLMDYALPRADNFPNVEVVVLELRPSPNNPLGAKGAGEGGVIPVAGVIANAVAAALGPLGVPVRDLPLSAERVWRMIEACTKH